MTAGATDSPSLAEMKSRLIGALEVFQETVNPCEDGHVEHTAHDHFGRRIVHSMAGMMGADWDYDAVIDFIEKADDIRFASNPMHRATGHAGAVHSEDRWVSFATKRKK